MLSPGLPPASRVQPAPRVRDHARKATLQMAHIRIFVSFDERYDADLNDLLREQSNRFGSAFEVVESGRSGAHDGRGSEDPRRRIRESDEVVVICGEHTDESLSVSVELDIAREESKPYMLLWGRRDRMCTKPEGALATDGMYSWTREVLESQMGMTIRRAQPRVIPESCKRRDR